MTTDQLREIHMATPFRPFSIVMGDGTRYRVPHQEFLAYGPKSRIAVMFASKGRSHFLDLLLMTALEVDDEPPSRNGGNGRRRR